MKVRLDNEHYFRSHPELQALVQLFYKEVLGEKPPNILEYAGKFFDRAELGQVVSKSIESEAAAQARNQWLNDLIKGKTLIE